MKNKKDPFELSTLIVDNLDILEAYFYSKVYGGIKDEANDSLDYWLVNLDIEEVKSILSKKQTVDSISKQKQVELRKLAQQIFADQLEREQSDKLWLYLSYGLGLFILGYMVYHFIRFLMM